MPSVDDYIEVRVGEWMFWRLRGASDVALLEHLATIADLQPVSKHPQVLPFAWPPEPDEKNHFLKVFHQRQGLAKVKDLMLQAKSRRFWRQGLALSAAGFNVPLVVALGEKRRCGLLERSMVLTKKIDGQPAPSFLAALTYSRDSRAQVTKKRSVLTQLGQLVRRFHDLGFVHGDLVATNILVAGQSLDSMDFYIMDNDRTQRYPSWLMGHLRKRNLLQLNRMLLAHITLQDRMRFLRSYLMVHEFTQPHRDFAVWLEQKTRQRRHEVDGADTSVSFRRLMACP